MKSKLQKQERNTDKKKTQKRATRALKRQRSYTEEEQIAVLVVKTTKKRE